MCWTLAVLVVLRRYSPMNIHHLPPRTAAVAQLEQLLGFATVAAGETFFGRKQHTIGSA
jgi:hypothetical protein